MANQPGLLVSSVQLLSAVGLDQVHCSHAAHVVGVAHELSAWGVQAYFAAVASHPAAAGFTPLGSFSSLSARRSQAVIVVDAVVVLAQHREIRRLGMPAVFVGVDVVDLASVGRHIAVRPRTDKVFRHR